MTIKKLITLSLLSAAITSRGTAQTQLLTLEAGQRTDQHFNGVTRQVPFAGIAGSGVLMGSASENFAWLMPFSFEARLSTGSVTDVNGFFDVAWRVHALTFGGGIAGTWDMVSDIKDAKLGGTDGMLNITYPIAVGYDGFVKLNFGPQSRMFVQGRYTLMPGSLALTYHSAEDRQAIAEGTVKSQDVPQQDSPLLRGAVGYTFDKVIVRAQVIQETWRYDRVYANGTGAFDRNSRILSLGISWIL